MAIKKRVERPAQTIKTNITPINQALKTKISNAFQAVVDAIKLKHLS